MVLIRQRSQLVIDQRQELIGGRRIALFDLVQNLCDVGHNQQNNAQWHGKQEMLVVPGL